MRDRACPSTLTPPTWQLLFRYPAASSARRRSGGFFQSPARRRYRRRIRSLRKRASVPLALWAVPRAAGNRNSENCSGRSATRADREWDGCMNLSAAGLPAILWFRQEPAWPLDDTTRQRVRQIDDAGIVFLIWIALMPLMLGPERSTN